MSDDQRILMPGVDLSGWPEMKLAHGNAAIRTLHNQVDTWNAAGKIRTKLVQPVPTRVEMRLHVIAQPPVEEWSLWLGDALHSFRSALDALAWQLAHIDGAKPARPKDIYFPISRDPADWDKRWLPLFVHVAPEILDRLHAVQPFNLFPDEPNSHLHMLHQLDIDDKHKGLLRAEAFIEDLTLAGGVRPLVNGHAVHSTRRDEWPILIEEDVVLGTYTSDVELETRPTVASRVTVSPVLNYAGDAYTAFGALDNLAEMLRLIIDTIYGGISYSHMLSQTRSSHGEQPAAGWTSDPAGGYY